ncbi:MAG TPA: CaiB/BaiF CoA-transferase family protein [Nitrososphaerales archaeon]|nr:CaiB/BaiF CoA-transferase family protein [Nitrososphaerales archaeon]
MSLNGIKVLDITHQIAGPWSTELLIDLGAQVTKIENPTSGGDPARKYPYFGSAVFVSENRGKRSVTLNLKSEKGREIALKLAASCDVLVENFTPGLLEKLGLGYEAVRKVNPRIVYCSISGFGKDSPYKDRPAWDAALQAMAGIMTITGEPDRPPLRVGTSIVDLSAGTYAVCGILVALLERERTGEGKFVDISLFDSAASLVNYWASYASITGRVPQRMGNTWPALAPYQVFKTTNGYAFIGASNDDFFRKLCSVLKLDHLTSDARFSTNESRVKNMKELAALIDEATSSWDNESLVRELAAIGVPCAPVNTVDKLLEDQSLRQRGLVVDAEYSGVGEREFRVTSSPLRTMFGRKAANEERQKVPSLGQHSDQVLIELGYSESEIKQFREQGVI